MKQRDLVPNSSSPSGPLLEEQLNYPQTLIHYVKKDGSETIWNYQ